MRLWYYFFYILGLRREELVPLQYKDVNLDEKYILINKAVTFQKNQPTIKKTKNEEVRKVPIFDILYNDLKILKSNHKSSEYIFPNTLNKMMSETCLKRKLSYVLKDINLKLKSDTQKDVSENEKANCEYENIKFTLHQLRHTYACILHKAGIDIKQAQIWMGHKDIKVLLNIYTHLDSQDNVKSIEKVNQFLG